MNKRYTYLFGAVLLALFAGFALASFRSTLTPYVSYDEARQSPRTVQVAGALEKGSSGYDDSQGALRFMLREPETGQTLKIRYHGLKPGNFEDAISVVAIGRYEPGANEFAAEKLLVKCPSKYQGAEAEEKVYD
jgi:cytochrome c-type biogenesis protein CcmE